MSQDNDETFMYHDYETNFYVDNAVDDMINPVPELDPNTLVDQAGFVNQTGSNKSMGSDQLNSRINSTSSSYNNLSGINSTKNNPSISFTIPGGFKENDYMEIDDSPPFTIESDLYFDSQSNNNNNQSVDDYKQRETLFPHNQYFIRQFKQSDQTQNPNNLSPNSNIPLSNVNTPNPSYKNQFETPRSVSGSLVNTSVFFQDNYDQVSENHSQFGDTPIYSNYNNEGDVSHFDNHMRNPSIDSHFNGPASISNNPNHYLQDLSPLTTNTSLTHSVNSIHSTQPSFLSAQQYLSRHSIELTNSNINPVEYLANTRNSIDSGNSSHRQPRNNNRYLSFTNSISNYIPFMGDKNGQRTGNSPGNGGPPSPISNSSGSSAFFHSQPTPRQQPKHLIRSIFKSNPSQQESPGSDALTPNDDILLNRNNGNEIFVNDEGLNIEGFVNDGVVDNTDFVAVHDNELPVIVQNKKIKKPKRSLFTRFKTPNKIESDDQTSEIINDGSSKHSGNTSFNQELDENDPNAVNTSETASSQSIRTNVQAGSSSSNINNPLESSNSESSQQPNYAALFENVGKRKKNKNSAFKKNNKKSEKVEGEYTDEESNNESHVNEKDSFDSSFSKSTSNTSHSQFLHDHNLRLEEGEEESDSILTNASKKILGSKLMKRKVNKRQPDVTTSIIKDSNEAKVGLKTLDLPEAVQAYPTSVVNAKSRTRGRKENKEADMVDSSKIYLCSYCSRRFKRQEHLKRHFRSLHTFDKPFDCHICHKKFSRSDNLNQHLKTHKEEEGESPEISTVSS